MANKQVGIEISTKDNASHKIDEINKKLNNLNIIMAKVNANRIDIMGNNNSVVVNQVIDGMNKVGDSAKKTNTTFKDMFSVAKLSAFAYSLKRIFSTMTNLTKESANFVENLNLTEVAFNGNTSAVKNLYTTMSDLYNLDESQIVRRIGVFKQMANAMGLSEEAGQNLSELLNKMTLDVSSLYNISIERSSNALQSALVGQTRPIRGATGADITEKTLERTVVQITPDRYIRDLSFLEKRLVMIISLTSQLSNSQGDWARTIESTDNQLRILNEQTTRFSRALGNVLMPIIGKLLPYLNAFMMVLTEITNAFARLVGFKLPKFDYSGLKGVSDGALDIEEQLNGASESANKLKSGLRGFDKLNVITTPKAGGGSGVGSGIDPRIMEAFNKAAQEYDDMMDKVQTKASKIADSVLKWLGFSKDINGEWKFNKITLGTILGIVGGIVAFLIPISTVWGMLNKIGLFSGFKNMYDITKKTFDLISSGKILSVLSKFALKTLGITAIIVGIYEAIIGVKKILNGEKLEGILKIIEGIALVVAGVAVLLGAWPVALVAGIVTAVAVITQVIIDNWSSISNFFIKIWDSFYTTIIEPIVKFVSGIAQTIYNLAIKPIINFFAPMIDAIGSIFDRIIKNVAEISIGIGKAIWSIISKIGEILLKVIEIGIAIGKAIYDYIIKPIFEFIGNIFSWTYNNAVKPIINLFADVGTWVYNHIAKPIWDKIIWIKDKAVGIFKSIGTTVVDFMGGIFKSVINGIFTMIENSINFFIKALNKAVGLINKIPGVKIDKVSLLSIPKLESGGFPKIGELFVANEAGPEVISTLGGKSVVANMEQMMLYLDRRIDSKLGGNNTQKQPAVFNISVGNREYAKYMLEDLNDIAKNNGQALRIGV